jgi:hypothetical protein
MRRTPSAVAAVCALLFAGASTLVAPSPTAAACLVVQGAIADPVAEYAHTILLARVPRFVEPEGRATLKVLEVYRGEPGATIELDDHAIACEHLSRLEGRRVLMVLGHEPGHGQFTTGWFESGTDWVQFGNSYDTLWALLHALGVEGNLPDTAVSAVGRDATSGVIVPVAGWLAGWAMLGLGLMVRLRSRRPS